MNTIKYILSCVVGILDAWVGRGTNGGIKEAVVGFSTMLIVVTLFFTVLRFFDNRTTFSSAVNVLCSIGVTTLLVCTMLAIIAVIEKMVY